MLADGGGTREQAVFLNGFDGSQRGGTGNRMATVCATQGSQARRIHDFGAAGHRSDGHASTQRFRHRDQIRLNSEMFRGEPFAGTSESGLHFISDKENAVFAGDILQQLEVLARGNDEAAFTENRLGDDGGDGFRSHGTSEGVFQMIRESFGGGALFAAVRISKGNAVDIAGEGLKAGFVRMRFAGQRHGEKRAAMEGVFETDYRRALGVGPGDLDGVFDSLGARVEEDGFLRKLAGGQGVEFFRYSNVALIGRDGKAEVQVLLELLADGGDHPGRAMADVEAADTASEIEVAITVDILDGGAFCACGENRHGVRWAAWNRGFAAGHQSACP